MTLQAVSFLLIIICRVVAIIAEGVPERDTKQLIATAQSNNKIIIGPATVGGVQVGSLGLEFMVEGFMIAY